MTRPTGTILWVVVAKDDDGRRWRLRAKRVGLARKVGRHLSRGRPPAISS
jgi:hypothetical protein